MKPFRIIVHIGAGKTGTTSIQRTLRNNHENLTKQGVWYLGGLLELAPEQKYPWQNIQKSHTLLSLEDEIIIEQFVDILHRSINKMIAVGCNTAIISNETFFDRPKYHRTIINAFKILADEGVDIEIIAYVRRHDTWLKSAYMQWGLKHKTYQGRLLPFSQWIKTFHIRFSDCLRPWMATNRFKFYIRNVDTVTNVVDDFFDIVEIQANGIETQVRENVSLGLEELLLRALFNDQFNKDVLPSLFDKLMSFNGINFEKPISKQLNSYLPTGAELEQAINNHFQDDINEVNSILVAFGQTPLNMTNLEPESTEVDTDRLLSVIYGMLVNQAKKIESLESKITDLLHQNNTEER